MPKLSADGWARAAYRSSNIVADSGGLRPDVPAQTSEVVYKVQAANVIASQKIEAQFARTDPLAAATLSISVNHGTTWTDVATIGSTTGSAVPLTVSLHTEVTGSYETLAPDPDAVGRRDT